jgi:hypothetical protein
MTMNESEDFETRHEKYLEYLASFHSIPDGYETPFKEYLAQRKAVNYSKPDLMALAEVAARRELRRELEDKLLFYPLGKKDILGLILAYTLTIIGISINLTIFVLTQMGKI